MEVIQRETLVSLSNSVNLLLQEICSIELPDNFRSMKKVKETLVDLQDVLYCSSNKIIPTQANNKSLNLLRRVVFQVANLLHETHFLRYANLLQIFIRLRFFIETIESKAEYLIQILKESRLGEQLHDDGSSIYGRDSDIQKLKHLLLSNSSDGDCKIRIISIVGMGGIGKTTLAKHLYYDPQVKDKFELKLWADFSQDVNDSSVFDNILESITSQKNTNNTIYPKFLLVLDGVWDAISVNWTLLMDILNAGETGGSRIIVTSRDERVALSMKTFLSVHYLRPSPTGGWLNEFSTCKLLFNKNGPFKFFSWHSVASVCNNSLE